MKQILHYLLISVGLIILVNFAGNSQQLYVGANYHPHDDKNLEKIKKDIELMKSASLVRLSASSPRKQYRFQESVKDLRNPFFSLSAPISCLRWF